MSQMNAKGWSLGLANGKVGWFPGDFVEIKPPPPADKKTRCAYACQLDSCLRVFAVVLGIQFSSMFNIM